jgi:ABC-type nitrate/sulfonate/bicarbonate transport system permease component
VFPMLRMAREGVATTPPQWMLAARNLGASPWDLAWRVRIPAALPMTLTGLRLGWTLAWMSVVAAELVGADGGLGQMILDARNLARPDIAIAGMFVIGGIAWASEAAISLRMPLSPRSGGRVAEGREGGRS